MGAPKTKHTARLRELRKVRERVMALPRGEVLTSDPMSKILGVRWATLREWCRDIEGFEESGAFEGGANGIAYQFCPVRTLWFLIDHFSALAEKDQERADRMRAMALGNDADAMAGLGLDEMKSLLDTQSRYMELRAKAKVLVDAPKLKTAVEKAFSSMQDAALTAAQELDPTGQWPAATRAIVDKVSRQILTKQRAAAREAIEGLKQGTG